MSVTALATEELAERFLRMNQICTQVPQPWQHHSLMGGGIGDRCFSLTREQAGGRYASADLHFQKGRVEVGILSEHLMPAGSAERRRGRGETPVASVPFPTIETRKTEMERVARLVETKIIYGGYAEPVVDSKAELNGKELPTKTLTIQKAPVVVCYLEELCWAAGIEPEWDKEWRSAVLRRAGRTCEVRLGRNTLTSDDRTIPLPIMPFLWGGDRSRTVIPVREVASLLGLKLSLDSR